MNFRIHMTTESGQREAKMTAKSIQPIYIVKCISTHNICYSMQISRWTMAFWCQVVASIHYHLTKWYTQNTYQHVVFMQLQPKATLAISFKTPIFISVAFLVGWRMSCWITVIERRAWKNSTRYNEIVFGLCNSFATPIIICTTPGVLFSTPSTWKIR